MHFVPICLTLIWRNGTIFPWCLLIRSAREFATHLSIIHKSELTIQEATLRFDHMVIFSHFMTTHICLPNQPNFVSLLVADWYDGDLTVSARLIIHHHDIHCYFQIDIHVLWYLKNVTIFYIFPNNFKFNIYCGLIKLII